jgi:hypothetical protein
MMAKLLSLSAVLLVFSGCATFTVQKYSISPENNAALRGLNGVAVNVGPFASASSIKNELSCRGAAVGTRGGIPYSEYVRRALIDELRVANVLSEAAPVTITGRLDVLDFSSTDGRWNIHLLLNSSRGRTMTVVENYSYETSFSGLQACEMTANALVPAVQSLIGRLARSQEFAALVSQ